ncbi:hypothetical protein D9M71_241010 [compost metagenome]
MHGGEAHESADQLGEGRGGLVDRLGGGHVQRLRRVHADALQGAGVDGAIHGAPLVAADGADFVTDHALGAVLVDRVVLVVLDRGVEVALGVQHDLLGAALVVEAQHVGVLHRALVEGTGDDAALGLRFGQ